MATISNDTKCKLMQRLYHRQDISDIVFKNDITDKMLDKIKEELSYITGDVEQEAMTNEDILSNKNKFKKCSWQIIQKSSQILLDKLYRIEKRESEIDDLIEQIENCLSIENYDKTQMAKLIKLLDNIKQNSISELARVIHIFYGKQDEKNTPKGEEDDLESLLENLTGDDF